MAANPLFVGTLVGLKQKLRMDGATAAASVAIFEEALLATRTFFYRRLGSARLAVIVAAAYTDSPNTDAEYLRAVGGNAEVRQMMLELMQRLPVFLGDATPTALRSWNEEGFLRDVAGDTITQKADMLRAQIEQDLEFLAGDETAGDELLSHFATIEPAIAPPKPFETVWPPA